jgi:Mg2+/Co2+ transporter CorB
LIANARRAIKIGLFTFTFSFLISYSFQFSLAAWVSIFILGLIVITGILFDIIGTSVTAANEAPFHAMGACKVKGSKQAIYLIRHADRVANFCNDVVGDIAGTISGAIIASISLEFVKNGSIISEQLFGAAAIAFIAALTVGGKALGKFYAIAKANQIVYLAGRLLSLIRIVDFEFKQRKRKNRGNLRKVR